MKRQSRRSHPCAHLASSFLGRSGQERNRLIRRGLRCAQSVTEILYEADDADPEGAAENVPELNEKPL